MFYDDVIATRSIRRFNPVRTISRKELLNLIDTARLTPSAANLQPLKYMAVCEEERLAKVFPHLRWAGYLTDWDGPEEGERPTGYIIILGDKTISENVVYDHSIASLAIMLGATELGLGGCIIGAVDREGLAADMNIDTDRYDILLVCALGKPAEKVMLEEVPEGASIKYYRDANDVHCVPKRTLKEVVID
ncbi:MAG: nitroreductase family protein [Abditibacteriota bacterium]|nr:nitroreductase family protein [Abditibacteriota bacterium]MBP5093947.1 nitroreductase family protein [Abditibacteriota bacterium]MBP5738188.1 nitroreductase family protein [Abditibacteriota bacterium]